MKTPLPLFFSYSSYEQFASVISPNLSERYISEIKRLSDLNLPPVVSLSVLAAAIGISSNFLASIIKNKEEHYRVFQISKGKGKKKRLIEAPNVSLKIIQSWLSYHLSRSSCLNLSESAFGFIPGVNGIYEAAKKHCESQWILSIDLQDFFHYINYDKIVISLQTIGYNEQQSNLIANIATLSNRLPQGSPLSPVISNLAFKKTDEHIEKLLIDRGITYTRYADDLVFSGKSYLDIKRLISVISAIIIEDGWVIAKDKVRFSFSPNRLKVHGFLVHEEKPRLTKGYRNKIRAYKHLYEKGIIIDHDLPKIKGHINYADYIDSLNSN